MNAKIMCQGCGMLYSFDTGKEIDGFRATICPSCGHEQIVYIEFRAIVVPVPVGYAQRT